MSDTYKGAIDCDIHPRVPTPRAVSQYMDEHWRDTVEVRGIETWDSIAYPPNAPLTARQDWRQAGADTDRGVERATAAINRFPDLFEQHWLDGMRAKLGLFTKEDGDKTLVDDLLAWMHRRSADFTNTFRALTVERPVGDATDGDPEVEAWHRRLAVRRGRQPQSATEVENLMRAHNPAFIPRNHNVEAALEAAISADDYSAMEQLLDVLATPYDHERDVPIFTTPGAGESLYRTFCGT